jgi:hypothetical protein
MEFGLIKRYRCYPDGYNGHGYNTASMFGSSNGQFVDKDELAEQLETITTLTDLQVVIKALRAK